MLAPGRSYISGRRLFLGHSASFHVAARRDRHPNGICQFRSALALLQASVHRRDRCRGGCEGNLRRRRDFAAGDSGFLLEVVDPYSLNRQGGDRGTQYRTGIYYTDPVSGQVAEDFIGRKQMEADREIMIEVLPLANFYPAEEYHQDYLLKNPGGYCHVNPALFAEARDYIPKSVTEAMTASEADSSDLRGRLTPHAICRDAPRSHRAAVPQRILG